MDHLSQDWDALENTLQRWNQGDRKARKEALDLVQRLRKEIGSSGGPSDELEALLTISREMNSILALDELLAFIMDQAVMLAKAERGFLVLWDQEADDFEIAIARRFTPGEVDKAEVSHGLIRRVMATKEPVITTNAQEDPRFQASQSIIAYQIRSVLAVPLVTREELIGAIYLDTRLSSRYFTENDLSLVKGLADQAATALRIARLYDNLQAKNRELEAALQELKETQNELIRAERLSVVGRMASAIIHDLKNPMTTIKGFADLLGRADLTPESRKRFSEKVTHTIDAFVGMTQEILDYARGSSALNLGITQVSEFVEDICSFVRPEFNQRNIEIQTVLKYSGAMIIDREKLWRVFMNIANNARDALEDKGSFVITSHLLDDSVVEFWLADNGPGIPGEIRERLFEPFVTHGKQYGTGLGLAISKKIVEDHSGTIVVETRPGQGACFIIRIPRGEIESVAEAEEAQIADSPAQAE